MKSIYLLLLFVMLSFLAACSNPFSNDEKCPCDVKIVNLKSDGSYGQETVQIRTLSDLSSVSSPIIHVTVNPQIEADGSIQEYKPHAQYMVTGDHKLIPKTTQTSELFTLYKIMENLHDLDILTGADQFLKYPRTISLITQNAPQAHDKQNDPENNAVYIPMVDRILVYKYQDDPQSQYHVTLAQNQGVIAHEYFHSIFQAILDPERKTVFRMASVTPRSAEGNLPPEVNAIDGFNFLILKSLNEGMADFWEYLYTGLANPYLASFSPKMQYRSVITQVQAMPDATDLLNMFNYSDYIREDLRSPENSTIHSEVYAKGTYFSGFLRTLSETLFHSKDIANPDNKKIVGQWVIRSLQRLNEVATANPGRLVLPTDIAKAFMGEVTDQKNRNDACLIVKSFLKNYDRSQICPN